MTEPSKDRLAPVVAQTNTPFTLDEALTSRCTTRPDLEQPTQAIIHPARMNQLTHPQCSSVPALSWAVFEPGFKDWCRELNMQIDSQLLDLGDGEQIDLYKLHVEVIAAGSVAQVCRAQ